MDRTRRRVDRSHVLAVPGASRLLQRRPAIRMAVLAILFLYCYSAFAQMPAGGIQGVYPAQVHPGQPVLYGILQQLPPPPLEVAVPEEWRNGVLLRGMITAEPGARRQTGDTACRQCTAQHFFLLAPEPHTGAHREVRALRHPPGWVTYLDVKGKEYALFRIQVMRIEEGFRLTGATLMRTGFLPAILKKRLRLRFDEALPAGARKHRIVATALGETGKSTPGVR